MAGISPRGTTRWYENTSERFEQTWSRQTRTMESRTNSQAEGESQSWARFHQQIPVENPGEKNAHDSSQGMEEKHVQTSSNQ